MSGSIWGFILENYTDARGFESFCNEVLSYQYTNLEPVGGVHDSGRDGLVMLDRLDDGEEDRVYLKKRGKKGQLIVCQYSLQEDWRAKVRQTLSRLREAQIDYMKLVFVTNRITHRPHIDKLEAEASNEYEVDLDVYGREYLRVFLTTRDYPNLRRYFEPMIAEARALGLESCLFGSTQDTEAKKRRALILLSTFVFSPESEDLRTEVARQLLLSCLYAEGTSSWHSAEQILEDLRLIFNTEELFCATELGNLLDALVKSKHVETTNGHFRLSEETHRRIVEQVERAYVNDADFFQALLDEVAIALGVELLVGDERQECKMALSKGLSRLFEQRGIEIATALVHQSGFALSRDYPELPIIADQCTEGIANPALREATRKVVIRLFAEPKEEESRYLFRVAQTFVIYEVFHFDPECRALSREAILSTAVFLDTDVLLLLLAGDARGEFYHRMLTANRNVGITNYTTSEVVREVARYILRSGWRYSYAGEPKLKDLSAEKAEEFVNDVFIVSYLRQQANGSAQRWTEYITGIRGPNRDLEAATAHIVEVLEQKHNVLTKNFAQARQAIDENERRALVESITKARQEGRAFKDERLYETDALLALLIHELQKAAEEDPRKQARYWLVSSDGYLARCWAALRDDGRVPVFTPSNWSQYVATLPKSAVSPVDFQKLVVSAAVTRAGQATSTELFLALIRYGIQVNKLNNEALRELLRELEQAQIWQKYLEPKLDISEDERLEKVALAFERIAEEQRRETDELVEREKDRAERLRAARAEVQKRDEEIEKLRRELERVGRKLTSKKRYERMTGQDKRKR